MSLREGSPAKACSGLMLIDRPDSTEVHGAALDCPKVLQCQPANAGNLLQFLDLNPISTTLTSSLDSSVWVLFIVLSIFLQDLIEERTSKLNLRFPG